MLNENGGEGWRKRLGVEPRITRAKSFILNRCHDWVPCLAGNRTVHAPETLDQVDADSDVLELCCLFVFVACVVLLNVLNGW